MNWFLDLVAEVGCTTWSMEQVAQEDVLEELAARQKAVPSLYAYHVVNMAHFGVPQERKRVIAGSPALVSRMQGRADPLRAPRVMDVIPDHPALAVGIKGRRATLGREWYKKHAKAFQTPINKIPMELRMKRGGLSRPAPTVLASSPLRWVDATGKTIVTLSIEQPGSARGMSVESARSEFLGSHDDEPRHSVSTGRAHFAADTRYGWSCGSSLCRLLFRRNHAVSD